MIFIKSFLFCTILSSLLIFISRKYKILLNFNGSTHQEFYTYKKIPLISGITILLYTFFFLDYHPITKLFFLSIFLVGFLADFKILKSPKKRFILQFFVIITFLLIADLKIGYTHFQLLDYFLENIIFNFFFTSSCILIVINGTNFIDGCNNNVIGYFLSISVILLSLNINNAYIFQSINNLFLISLLLFLLVLNIMNKAYLGDGGAFLLSFIYSIILIDFHFNNPQISSFFIVLLLWYPAFENFFSIIRKFYFAKSPAIPDNYHLHQLFYLFLNKKFNINKLLANNLVGIIINLYNFFIFFIAHLYFYHTQLMLMLILINIMIYIFLYLSLHNFKIKNI